MRNNFLKPFKIDELPLLVHVAVLALLFCFLIHFTRFFWLIGLLKSMNTGNLKDKKQVKKIIEAVNFLARKKFFVIRNNCLKKTLLLYYFLRKAGLADLQINIGVHKTYGKLVGHSWLVLNGQPYLEDEEFSKNFAVIYSSGA